LPRSSWILHWRPPGVWPLPPLLIPTRRGERKPRRAKRLAHSQARAHGGNGGGGRRQQGVDGRRAHDGAVAREGLVIGLDRIGIVEIVDHEAEGFLDAARRDVAEPVDALEPGAVAEMET